MTVIDHLSDEFHKRVVDKLRDRGFESAYEFPGFIGIHVGPFYVKIGQHAWDYGSVDIGYLSPDELHGMTYEPYESVVLDAPLAPDAHDADEIADQWAGVIRLFAADERVKRSLVA